MGESTQDEVVLLTATEAIERWPFDLYPTDTLGGMRRDIIVRFWTLLDDMPAIARPLALRTFGRQIAADQARIDELMEHGLRTAFASLMGYELP